MIKPRNPRQLRTISTFPNQAQPFPQRKSQALWECQSCGSQGSSLRGQRRHKCQPKRSGSPR